MIGFRYSFLYVHRKEGREWGLYGRGMAVEQYNALRLEPTSPPCYLPPPNTRIWGYEFKWPLMRRTVEIHDPERHFKNICLHEFPHFVFFRKVSDKNLDNWIEEIRIEGYDKLYIYFIASITSVMVYFNWQIITFL